MAFVFLFCVFEFGASCASASDLHPLRTEADYQAVLCAEFQRNVFIRKSGTWADCVSGNLAIEVDFSGKWAEAIGQAMHYANELGKEIGIILVCKRVTSPEVCAKHSYLAEETLVRWGLAATLWHCPTQTQNLFDCQKIDVRP